MRRSFGDFKPLSERVKASGIKLVCQVQTIEQAAAVVALGADAVVAQVLLTLQVPFQVHPDVSKWGGRQGLHSILKSCSC